LAPFPRAIASSPCREHRHSDAGRGVQPQRGESHDATALGNRCLRSQAIQPRASRQHDTSKNPRRCRDAMSLTSLRKAGDSLRLTARLSAVARLADSTKTVRCTPAEPALAPSLGLTALRHCVVSSGRNASRLRGSIDSVEDAHPSDRFQSPNDEPPNFTTKITMTRCVATQGTATIAGAIFL
jgi:hypothetical protein